MLLTTTYNYYNIQFIQWVAIVILEIKVYWIMKNQITDIIFLRQKVFFRKRQNAFTANESNNQVSRLKIRSFL